MIKQQNFADCVAQNLPFLTRFVHRLVRSSEMAEDIIQQTCLKALTNADQFRFESTLKTWLSSIAINEVRQTYRSGWLKRVIPLTTEANGIDRGHPIELPSSSHDRNERAVILQHAVSRLPHMYRSVVELCELQSMTMKEAAQKLGITLPAVKSRRHRARQKLRPLVSKLRS